MGIGRTGLPLVLQAPTRSKNQEEEEEERSLKDRLLLDLHKISIMSLNLKPKKSEVYDVKRDRMKIEAWIYRAES